MERHGLFTAGWLLTRGYSGGNTKASGRSTARIGVARLGRGLFTAVSIYWVLIGGNTNWLRHGMSRQGQARRGKGCYQRGDRSMSVHFGGNTNLGSACNGVTRLGSQCHGLAGAANAAGWIFNRGFISMQACIKQLKERP